MRDEKSSAKIWERNATSSKMIIIGVLALLLLIPASMVGGLIDEREERKASVTREIGSKWGEAQTLTGPVIRIPYLEHYRDGAGRVTTSRKELYLLPETLEIKAAVDPGTRYRGIYNAVVYSSKILMKGAFDLAALKQSGVRNEDLLFDAATIFLGMSDMKGVRDQIAAALNGAFLTAEAVIVLPLVQPV